VEDGVEGGWWFWILLSQGWLVRKHWINGSVPEVVWRQKKIHIFERRPYLFIAKFCKIPTTLKLVVKPVAEYQQKTDTNERRVSHELWLTNSTQ
jgi:hypothetical protein